MSDLATAHKALSIAQAIANDIAEPFSMAPNALALDAITRTLERSLLELCDQPIPDEIGPVRPYQHT